MEALTMPNELNGRFAEEALGGVRMAEITAEDSNARTAKLQLLKRNGQEMERKSAVMAYLASDEDGNVIESSSGTLSVAAGTDGLLIELATDNCFMLVSEDDGDMDVTITQTSGADTHYLCVVLPDGQVFVSEAITFAA